MTMTVKAGDGQWDHGRGPRGSFAACRVISPAVHKLACSLGTAARPPWSLLCLRLSFCSSNFMGKKLPHFDTVSHLFPSHSGLPVPCTCTIQEWADRGPDPAARGPSAPRQGHWLGRRALPGSQEASPDGVFWWVSRTVLCDLTQAPPWASGSSFVE